MKNNFSNIIYKIADESDLRPALAFLQKRYVEVGYLSNDLKNKCYHDDFVKNSVYFVAKRSNSIVGVIRLIFSESNNLPVLQEYEVSNKYKEVDFLNNFKLAEIGNLAAIPGENVAIGLYKIALLYAITNKRTHLVAAIDAGFYRHLKKRFLFFRCVCSEIAAPKYYVGSLSVPVMIKLNKIMILLICNLKEK